MTAPAPVPDKKAQAQALDERLWRAAHNHYDHALKSARAIWPPDTGEDTLHSAAASILNHYRELRSALTRPSKGGGLRGGAPSSNGVPAPSCPTCQGAMYDNRRTKKAPNAPDFRCKNKGCLDDQGRVMAGWVDSKQPSGFRFAKPAEAGPRDYDDRLGDDYDDDDLPF